MSVTSTLPTNGKVLTKSKRQNKKPSEDISKSGNTEREKETATLPTSPGDTSDAVQHELAKPEKELLKELSKRLRKSTKKLEGIERSEEKIKDLTDEEKLLTTLINKDERKKIADKPITKAIHKELQEVYDKLKEQIEAEERLWEQKIEDQKRQFEAKLESSIKQAQEEGFRKGFADGRQKYVDEGRNQVTTLVKFLRLAGFRRSVKSDIPQEDEAIEQVLVLVYTGDDTALDTCWKLSDGSSDMVGDSHNVSFARIKELAHGLVIDSDEDDTPLQETSAAVTKTTATTEPQVVQKTVRESENGALGIQVAGHKITCSMGDGVPGSELAPEKRDVAVSPVEAEPSRRTNGCAIQGPADMDVKNSATAVSEFQSVENRRGKGNRGHRGRSDGNFRGRGRAGFRGDKGEHRGRGSFRGRRGDGTRGGRGNQHQPQGQATSTTPVN